MKKLIAIGMTLTLFLASCTENERAKNYGGTAKVSLPKGQKLVTVTWKDDNIWYLTKTMHATDTPETYTFKEESSYGIIQGAVIITEQR